VKIRVIGGLTLASLTLLIPPNSLNLFARANHLGLARKKISVNIRIIRGKRKNPRKSERIRINPSYLWFKEINPYKSELSVVQKKNSAQPTDQAL